MKYTIEDIKALVNTEKAIIKRDNEKRENKIAECKNNIDFGKLFELDKCLIELGNIHQIDYCEYHSNGYGLYFQYNSILFAVKNYGGYCKFVVNGKIDHFQRYDKEMDMAMYKWLADEFETICEYAENTIEQMYNKKLNNVLSLANKEY